MKAAATRQLLRLSALTDPVRRRVYEYVASSYPDAVDRDQVAGAAGISRKLAAFHLDRLTADDLVTASFARRSGRTGPGSGRPAKFYRRAAEEAAVSVPERHYDVAARVLAGVVTDTGIRDAVVAAGRAEGHLLGRLARENGRSLGDVLVDGGFEPIAHDGTIHLRNCPFAALTTDPRPVVCSMARAMVEGVAEELGMHTRVREDHRPGVCCVVVDDLHEAAD